MSKVWAISTSALPAAACKTDRKSTRLNSSHLGISDAVVCLKKTMIASHSSARALTDAPRNRRDEMLKAVAKNDGVVQVNFYNGFIDYFFFKATGAHQNYPSSPAQHFPD